MPVFFSSQFREYSAEPPPVMLPPDERSRLASQLRDTLREEFGATSADDSVIIPIVSTEGRNDPFATQTPEETGEPLPPLEWADWLANLADIDWGLPAAEYKFYSHDSQEEGDVAEQVREVDACFLCVPVGDRGATHPGLIQRVTVRESRRCGTGLQPVGDKQISVQYLGKSVVSAECLGNVVDGLRQCLAELNPESSDRESFRLAMVTHFETRRVLLTAVPSDTRADESKCLAAPSWAATAAEMRWSLLQLATRAADNLSEDGGALVRAFALGRWNVQLRSLACRPSTAGAKKPPIFGGSSSESFAATGSETLQELTSPHDWLQTLPASSPSNLPGSLLGENEDRSVPQVIERDYYGRDYRRRY